MIGFKPPFPFTDSTFFLCLRRIHSETHLYLIFSANFKVEIIAKLGDMEAVPGIGAVNLDMVYYPFFIASNLVNILEYE